MDSALTKKEKQKKKQTGRWSKEQHERFMIGIVQHGKDWKKVQQVVGTRSGSQVRSHAQKFFNRLQKQQQSVQEHDKRQGTGPAMIQIDSQSSNDFLKNVVQEQQSLVTPFELVSLIHKQSREDHTVNVNNFKKALEKGPTVNQKNQKIGEQNSEGGEKPKELNALNSFKSMSNILSAYENVKESEPIQYQNQSFLILLTKKYKKYFKNEEDFDKLIDFGKRPQILQQQQAIRKRSFTLLDGEDSEQRLEEIKKKINARVQEQTEAKNLTPQKRMVQESNFAKKQSSHESKQQKNVDKGKAK